MGLPADERGRGANAALWPLACPLGDEMHPVAPGNVWPPQDDEQRPPRLFVIALEVPRAPRYRVALAAVRALPAAALQLGVVVRGKRREVEIGLQARGRADA